MELIREVRIADLPMLVRLTLATKGQTLWAAANEIGCSAATLSRLSNGMGSPRIGLIEPITKWAGLNATEMMRLLT